MPKKSVEKKPLSFEAALGRLEEIVSQLEQGEALLDDALKIYEEGVALARFCGKQLESAERRVVLLDDQAGELHSRPFAATGLEADAELAGERPALTREASTDDPEDEPKPRGKSGRSRLA